MVTVVFSIDLLNFVAAAGGFRKRRLRINNRCLRQKTFKAEQILAGTRCRGRALGGQRGDRKIPSSTASAGRSNEGTPFSAGAASGRGGMLRPRANTSRSTMRETNNTISTYVPSVNQLVCIRSQNSRLALTLPSAISRTRRITGGGRSTISARCSSPIDSCRPASTRIFLAAATTVVRCTALPEVPVLGERL